MKVKRELVYRCEFCSGKKKSRSFRKHIMERHERSCFYNPNRKPHPGEITGVFRAGTWTYDHETNAADLEPDKRVEAWWPGDGMIYTGARWVPIPGFVGGEFSETWPDELDKVRPWIRRLHVLGIAPENMTERDRALISDFDGANDMYARGMQ